MIAEGSRFVVRHPVMRPSMMCATTTNFVCGGLLALVPLYLVRGLEVSPLLVGLLLASESVGSLLGAAFTPRLIRRVGSGRAVRTGARLGGRRSNGSPEQRLYQSLQASAERSIRWHVDHDELMDGRRW